jgi:hypothetical protein
MKKLVLIVGLLISSVISAQLVSVQFDYQNATKGSDVNKPSLNYLIKYLDVMNAFEVGFVIEGFHEIKYYSYGMLANYRVIDYKDISVFSNLREESIVTTLGFEVTRIGRYWGRNAEFFSVGGNAEVRYFFRAIGVTATYNYKYRTDQAYWNTNPKWVGSVFIGLVYNTKY